MDKLNHIIGQNDFFNVILDANWLMHQTSLSFPIPWAFDRNRVVEENSDGYPWDRMFQLPTKIITFRINLIIAKETKVEIGGLHQDVSLKSKTSNAKRIYSSLQKYFEPDSKWFEFRDADVASGEQDRFNLIEVDLSQIDQHQMFEVEMGPDSNVDKKLVTLAQMICDADPAFACFIATGDTGIHAEISHRHHRRGSRIFGPHMIEEWIACANQTASIVAKTQYPEGDWIAGKTPAMGS